MDRKPRKEDASLLMNSYLTQAPLDDEISPSDLSRLMRNDGLLDETNLNDLQSLNDKLLREEESFADFNQTKYFKQNTLHQE